MLNVKRIALIAMAVVAASATSAPAGTKYAVNLVSNSPTDPPPNPTLSPKSSLKLSDKGAVQVALAGVTDGAGALVTTPATLGIDGSEYIVIIKLTIPGIAGLIPLVEVPVALDLKAGKGKAKLNLSALFALIPGGIGRTLEILGAEVWGPLGAPNATACALVIGGAIPAGLPLGTTCRGGTQFGMSGLAIPAP